MIRSRKVIVYSAFLLALLGINKVFAKTPIAILYDDIFLEHNTGSGHPERPERLFDIIDTLKQNPDYKYDLVWPKVRKATNKEISLVHSMTYINLVENEIRGLINNSPTFLSTVDTIISPKSL